MGKDTSTQTMPFEGDERKGDIAQAEALKGQNSGLNEWEKVQWRKNGQQGLPDSNDDAQEPAREPALQEAMAPVLEEAAAHQRAKVMGLADPDPKPQSPAAASAPPELERREGIIRPIEEKKAEIPEDATHKRQEAISVPAGTKPMTAMEIESNKEGEKLPFKERLFQCKNSMEESANNVRLRMDAALEKQFGLQAEKIQTELEKARLSAISDSVRVAELLQGHMGQCATDLREQQRTLKPIDIKENLPENKIDVPAEPVEGDNIIAQRALDTHQGLKEAGHHAREKLDGALERQFGEKAHKLQIEGEKARESAINDTAHVAELLQGQFGKAASSFREQLTTGVTPNYH